ncbi:MAG: ABC transporter permease subunit [Chitinivibrionales bacterium]|nr:ABC transporter permease subunit [Chitinivibrionales bacterium]
MMAFIRFVLEKKAEILTLTGQHITLTGISVFLAIVCGVPLGILLSRIQWLARWVLGLAGIVQTIPSLALLGFLVPIPIIGGIGITPAIVALFLYSLLAIIRNTYTGIMQVDDSIKEAARGIGMTDWQLLTKVEFPLASPMIMAGIRISTVICIGIATLCAAIGAGGLGQFIFRGISLVNNTMILAGAVPAAILALLLDFIFERFESMMKPPM